MRFVLIALLAACNDDLNLPVGGGPAADRIDTILALDGDTAAGEAVLDVPHGGLRFVGSQGDVHVGASETDVREAAVLLRQRFEALEKAAVGFVVGKLHTALQALRTAALGPGLVHGFDPTPAQAPTRRSASRQSVRARQSRAAQASP